MDLWILTAIGAMGTFPRTGPGLLESTVIKKISQPEWRLTAGRVDELCQSTGPLRVLGCGSDPLGGEPLRTNGED